MKEPNKSVPENKFTDWEDPQLHFKIYKWCQEGYTMQRLADAIGVHLSTLYENMENYPEVNENIKEGRRLSFANLVKRAEHSIDKLVEGYSYTEQTIQQKSVGVDVKQNPVFEVTKKVTKKHSGPNVAATIFLLKSKAGYREKDEEETEKSALQIVRRVINSKADLPQNQIPDKNSIEDAEIEESKE